MHRYSRILTAFVSYPEQLASFRIFPPADRTAARTTSQLAQSCATKGIYDTTDHSKFKTQNLRNDTVAPTRGTQFSTEKDNNPCFNSDDLCSRLKAMTLIYVNQILLIHNSVPTSIKMHLATGALHLLISSAWKISFQRKNRSHKSSIACYICLNSDFTPASYETWQL